MKTIITSLFALFSLVSISQFDMAVQIDSPTDGENIASGEDIVLDITIINNGATLPEGDTLFLGFAVDGIFYGPNSGVLQGASVAGGGVPIPIENAASFAGFSDGEHTVCAWVIGLGSVLFGRNFDLSGVTNGTALNGITIEDVANGDPTPLDNAMCISVVIGDTTTGGGSGGEGNVGIDDLTSGNFTLFPNPANNTLTIDNHSTNGVVQIIDMLGKVVLVESIVGKVQFNISHLQEGAYFVRLIDTKGQLTEQQKLIIQH